MILALDPGTTQTAWVLWNGDAVRDHGITDNEELLEMLTSMDSGDTLLAIERVQSFGMPVGEELFATVFWSGRFVQAWHPRPWTRIYRRDVKLELCGSARAKDPNVRASLIDFFGGKSKAIGVKSAPGPLYGIRADEWAALAVALVAERLAERGVAA